MKEIKISLIIPMYNVEKYIEKCIDSCIYQDLSNEEYEIIIINDGTKDNSLKLAERKIAGIENARIVSQENKGLSEARNCGLKEANGEYVWFIDSDDYIYDNCLKQIYKQVLGKDVLCLSYTRIYENNDNEQHFVVNIGESKTGQDYLRKGNVWHPAQLYVYNRKFLLDNNLCFYPGIYHEDTEFTPRMLYYANNICSLETPVYYFLQRSNSITTTVNPKRSRDMIVVANSLDKFSSKIEDKQIIVFFHNTISLVLNNALYQMEKQNKKDVAEFKNLIVKNKHLFVHLLKSDILKYKIEGFMFYIFPKRSDKVYKFLRCFGGVK